MQTLPDNLEFQVDNALSLLLTQKGRPAFRYRGVKWDEYFDNDTTDEFSEKPSFKDGISLGTKSFGLGEKMYMNVSYYFNEAHPGCIGGHYHIGKTTNEHVYMNGNFSVGVPDHAFDSVSIDGFWSHREGKLFSLNALSCEPGSLYFHILNNKFFFPGASLKALVCVREKVIPTVKYKTDRIFINGEAYPYDRKWRERIAGAFSASEFCAALRKNSWGLKLDAARRLLVSLRTVTRNRLTTLRFLLW